MIKKIFILKGKEAPGNPQAKGVGENVCIKLVEKYFNTNTRTLTIDNFFTSISLAKTLLENGIFMCGTLKKNKAELPFQLLPNKNRPIHSSIFGFKDDYTLVSYVPKCNKAVVLVSTLHHTNTISSVLKDFKKPEIVLFYNKTKGSVDTFDQMVEHSSCRRRTNRWTFNALCYMIDAADLNAYQLFKFKNPHLFITNEMRMRRKMKERLAINLITFSVNERIRNASVNNFSGFSNQLIASFERLGFEIKKQHRRRISVEKSPTAKSPSARFECGNKICREKKSKTRFNNHCDFCQSFFCPDHGEISKTSLCKSCILDI